MKAIVISEDVSNIIYFWHDDEFTQQLHSITDANIDSNEDINSCVQSYFAPLILSYINLKSKLGEICSHVECEEKNLLIVFQPHNQFLYVALENAENYSKEKLTREISFLRSSIGLLFGPCGHYQLNDQRILRKQKAWRKISCMFESYMKLCSDENSFLLEGVEKLQINEEVSSASRLLIEKCVKSFIEPVMRKELQYVLIFVNAKLLHFDARRKEKKDLSTCSFLQIITLLYSNISKSDLGLPASSCFDSTVPSGFDSALENEDTSNFQTSTHDSSSSVFIDDPDDDTMLLKTDLDFLYDNTELFSETGSETRSNLSLPLSNYQYTDDANAERFQKTSFSSCSDSSESEDNGSGSLYTNENYFSSEDDNDYSQSIEHFGIPIYPSTRKIRFVPHVLYCASITTNIRMVFLTKNKDSVLSDIICGTLYWLRKLEFVDDKVHGADLQTLQKLRSCLNLLLSKSRKLKGSLRKKCTRLHDDWIKHGDACLRSVIESNDNNCLLKLEHSTKRLEHQLHNLFCELFPSLLEGKTVHDDIDLTKIQACAERKLSGYVDYLSVKAQQNVTMTAYLSKFPGMVHFAILRRSRSFCASDDKFLLQSDVFDDELITPSLTSSNSGVVSEVFPSLKKKFWNNAYLAHSHIIDGKSVFKHEDQEFIFTSYAWCGSKFSFSNSQNLPDRTSNHHASTSIFNFDKDFYKDFILSHSDPSPNLHVFQLFCIHFSVVPQEVISAQLEQLYDLLCQDLKLK